jgi:hypothetical protein
MGGVKLTPPVDEKISDIARRTAAVGEKLLVANGATLHDDGISIPTQDPATQPAELFTLADLMKHWNPDWQLERAGFGGAGGGIGNIRGITHLEADVLATWPRDGARRRLAEDCQLVKNPRSPSQWQLTPARVGAGGLCRKQGSFSETH